MPKYIDIEISQKKYCNLTLRVDDDKTIEEVYRELRQEFGKKLKKLIADIHPYWDDFNGELEIEEINKVSEEEALQYRIIKYE